MIMLAGMIALAILGVAVCIGLIRIIWDLCRKKPFTIGEFILELFCLDMLFSVIKLIGYALGEIFELIGEILSDV
jgi:hypothetical protein